LSEFRPEKLFIEYRDGVTATGPIIPRKYTLTHTDGTGELFLTMGTEIAWDKVNLKMRDEVIGEWIAEGSPSHYNIFLYIDRGEYDIQTATRRNEVFRRELPLALTAIRYGDRALFDTYPELNHAPIVVNFLSAYPELAKQENWGTFGLYSNKQ